MSLGWVRVRGLRVEIVDGSIEIGRGGGFWARVVNLVVVIVSAMGGVYLRIGIAVSLRGGFRRLWCSFVRVAAGRIRDSVLARWAG